MPFFDVDFDDVGNEPSSRVSKKVGVELLIFFSVSMNKEVSQFPPSLGYNLL